MQPLKCEVFDTLKNASKTVEVRSNKLARDIKYAAHAANKLEGHKRFIVTINFQ